MKGFAAVCLIALLLAPAAHAAGFYVTVAGHVGEADYEQRFTTSAKDLDKLLKATGSDVHVFSLIGADATRARLTQVLEQVAREAKADDDFVLTLIGHGSHDGVEYKFNLVGPDMSAPELAALCNRIAAKRQLIVNATSSSGGSIPAFQRAGRAIITSTKSGTEKNATVFVRYWVAALQDPSADVDKNEAVTALEAFEYAERKTAEFYTSQKRLATEHAVFEDTGKGEAVRAASAEGAEGRLLASLTLVRFGESQKAALDPAKRDLLTKREDLERRIDVLKYQKAAMSQTDYEQQLKALLIELARVQATLDKS
jgi:caspase domain-containing protein